MKPLIKNSSKFTIPTYSTATWTFNSGERTSTGVNQEIWMEIDGQRIDGFYAGDGVYKVRFVPKRTGDWKYVVNCTAKSLRGQTGDFSGSLCYCRPSTSLP